jgi:hypothetical protein
MSEFIERIAVRFHYELRLANEESGNAGERRGENEIPNEAGADDSDCSS